MNFVAKLYWRAADLLFRSLLFAPFAIPAYFIGMSGWSTGARTVLFSAALALNAILFDIVANAVINGAKEKAQSHNGYIQGAPVKK